MAFVTPASAAALASSQARRGHATCPSRPRSVVTMKKLRRGVEDDESNAVDVFGGGLSQEELLAQALGEGGEPVQTKKTKKGKKAVGVEDENAVDVFGGNGMSQEELLANALGGDEKQPAAGGKKKKKKGKKTVVEDESNAVDVFGGGASQEDLLAQALGEDPAENLSKKGKKNRKDVGAGADKTDNIYATEPETVLSDSDSPPDFQAQKKGKRAGKKTKPDKQSDVNIQYEKQAQSTLGDETEYVPHGTQESSPSDISTEINLGDVPEVDDSKTKLDIGGDGLPEEVEEDNFEPDTEILDEFTTSAQEFEQFTSAGRRKTTKNKREERNESERKMTDPRFANFGTGGNKFTSVRLEDVTMTFRNKTILSGVTWGVRTGERVGLIGENGSGKTTQLRIIAGLAEPTSGEVVSSSKQVKASFLRQEFVDELDPTRTLREEFAAAFSEENKVLDEYKQCEKDIADAGSNLEKLEVLLNKLEELRAQCDENDAWNLDARIDKVMPGLGFTEDDNEKLVAAFSGGWKVRIGLGKVLLQDPDLLLLDEPSNHLDTESVEWMEDFLQTCKLPMVVVSHDREFLDRVCTKIVEIESAEAFEYPGNYTTYVKLRAEQRKAWEAAYERQQKFVSEQMQFIKRNRRNSARSSQVKSREKMLERMERTGQMVRRPPRQGKPLMFRFPPAPRSGRDCVVVEELSHGYEGRTLFNDASIAIERGDRIALIGPNGCGKSTLLRLITGRESPQHGSVQCQELTNISLAYYEQNQADALDLEVTVLDTLKKASPDSMRYEEIRALLGKFLFKGDDVEKKVKALSGGEKARLALAKIMMEPSNVLVLDEPGNHLSISAKEMLEEAMQHFDGTLLLVSHDRYLISQVATQILAVEDKELVLYDGDYKSYMEKNAELKERLQARFIPGVAEIKSAPKIVIEEPLEMADKKQKRKKNFGGRGVGSGRVKEMNAKRWNKR